MVLASCHPALLAGTGSLENLVERPAAQRLRNLGGQAIKIAEAIKDEGQFEQRLESDKTRRLEALQGAECHAGSLRETGLCQVERQPAPLETITDLLKDIVWRLEQKSQYVIPIS
jgi:hypothetical protein